MQIKIHHSLHMLSNTDSWEIVTVIATVYDKNGTAWHTFEYNRDDFYGVYTIPDGSCFLRPVD